MKETRELATCALWVAALALLVFGTIDSTRENHNSPLLTWGIFLAIAAQAMTGWMLANWATTRRAQVDLDRIVEVVDALHDAKNDTQRLR